MKNETISRPNNWLILRTTGIITGMLLLVCTAGVVTGISQRAGAPRPDSKAFSSPDQAASALIAAASSYDENALKEIFGSQSYDIIHSGEPSLDKQNAMEFAALGAAKKNISIDPRNRSRAQLLVGDDDWPFPVPLVKQGSNWYFDTKAGRQEIIYRRIGSNELTAIDVCRGFVEAQREYALTKHDGAAVNQYARKIISSPGKQDGLAWQDANGNWGGAVGERAAKAIALSYTGTPAPFHGYYFKVLTGQGPSARLGQLDYMVNGAMIGGFALLAFPATYQVTGVKSFIVSYDGVVYEKDLGPKTLEVGRATELFDPDATWTQVNVDD
jgi:hypothetical protein